MIVDSFLLHAYTLKYSMIIEAIFNPMKSPRIGASSPQAVTLYAHRGASELELSFLGWMWLLDSSASV